MLFDAANIHLKELKNLAKYCGCDYVKKNPHASSSHRHYDWVIAPQMYFATALLLAKRICPRGNMFKNEWTNNNICLELNFRSSNPNYDFIWPMIFNLKHGIELYLKALGNIDHGKYYSSHDLKELFELLLSNSGSNAMIISNLYTNTWPVIEKYYCGTYIPGYTDVNSPDVMNEVERFPEGLKGTAYKINNHFKWFNCDVIADIAQDIRKLEQLFAQAQRDIDPQKKFVY